MADVYEIDGNTHDYEGMIIALHERGDYQIHHSAFVGSSESTDRSGKTTKSYQLALRCGLTHWMPLDRAFGKE